MIGDVSILIISFKYERLLIVLRWQEQVFNAQDLEFRASQLLDVPVVRIDDRRALDSGYPFHFSDYAGYSHVKTKDDGVGAVDESDEFVTYVFRLKERIGRKWITP